MKRKARQTALVVYRRAAPLARRATKAIGTAALDEKHTIAAVLAAAVLGYVEKNNPMTLPDPLRIGAPATLGLTAWVIGKATKSRVARHVATGALSIAAYQYAKGMS